jgi:predicted metal-binding membrane protein
MRDPGHRRAVCLHAHRVDHGHRSAIVGQLADRSVIEAIIAPPGAAFLLEARNWTDWPVATRCAREHARASAIPSAAHDGAPTARNRPEVTAGMLAAAALAWWWTVQRMLGVDASPGASLGTLGWFTGSWALMMAAMMLPSFAPTLAAYASRERAREPSRWLLFACGYLLVWTSAGLLAYGLYAAGKTLLSSELSWHGGGRWLAGGLIAVAAAYRFSPLKRACLARCRGQLAGPHATPQAG